MNFARLKRMGRAAVSVLALGLVLGSAPSVLRAQGSAESYGFASSLPAVTLPDPSGKNWTINQNNGQPTVVIVSVPNMSQGSIQQDWVNSLGSLSKQVNFYLLEDMKDTFFQSMALGQMKSDYSEGDRPVVLVDSVNGVRKQMGAPKGKTCVMIYNANNRLVYVQVGNASAAAVKAVNGVIAGLQN